MPRGKVIDPQGTQSSDMKWGYIQREDGPDWPGTAHKKVIPFKNKGNFELGEEVEFDIDDIDPEKDKAKLAVAKNVKKAK